MVLKYLIPFLVDLSASPCQTVTLDDSQGYSGTIPRGVNTPPAAGGVRLCG
jgi:hypothetical protein